jgi:hypothetical protein
MGTGHEARGQNNSNRSAAGLAWRRSTWCSTQSCVEVADLPDGSVAVRDSKSAESGVALIFSTDEWTSFVSGVKAGEFG